MTDNIVTVTVREYEPGRWVAMSSSSPYFCVEADSLVEVREIALEAIKFYSGVIERYRRLPVAERFKLD
jgi:hypothetical protein